jgi:hypothetical protein
MVLRALHIVYLHGRSESGLCGGMVRLRRTRNSL